eukprot:CAMPEP_0113495790 /NCGR_PEP_ID=MMETSP0014_2-20120614/29788_1 /TAXON_ID=2857 /ORGANISM="Nitzschia sp." /LENGTH=696 /DNA_ID=CAMNT_0000389693 /DNA_START=111 /DNA_END=2204 /DNA_ORIENTATION=+ /assembly_acc=CAM_ASM_000159
MSTSSPSSPTAAVPLRSSFTSSPNRHCTIRIQENPTSIPPSILMSSLPPPQSPQQQQQQQQQRPGAAGTNYYNSGSTEVATDTALTINRLEARRKLTKNSNKLVIVLVGLPARGKSFVARKLLNFLEWYGTQCKIFNVGKYRRQAVLSMQKQAEEEAQTEANDGSNGACDADFFDANNEKAAKLREEAATTALNEMLRWLDDEEDLPIENNGAEQTGGGRGGGIPNVQSSRSLASINSVSSNQATDRIAIFDATNSTAKRRQWVLEQCTSPAKRPGKPTGVVFVESICDDEELLNENFRFKVTNSPDYQGMSESEAMTDLRARVAKYEAQYETITDDSLSYIKIFNLSTKLLVNHIYGRMSKVIVPALMAWNIGSRPIFLCRPGQTLSDITTDRDDYVTAVNMNGSAFIDKSAHTQKRLSKGDSLGPGGKVFSDELYDFVFEESMDFTLKRASMMDNMQTGTSVSGLAKNTDSFQTNREAPFPIKIYTSTMPRASETVRWDEYDFRIEELSNLNPLDKGDFGGKELSEIQKTSPSWYSRLERDPFTTRFPGGESYKDLIRRLESVVVDLEQQVIPTLIISHVSVLQMLIAYFRRSPVQEAMQIEVPLHTVMKFTPARGGGWTETQHELAPVYERAYSGEVISSSSKVSIEGMEKVVGVVGTLNDYTTSPSPIWGDHIRRASTNSLETDTPGIPTLP